MINYVKGDATDPGKFVDLSAQNPAIIAHCCNNKGGWGKGFVLALSKRWAEPEANYRSWAKGPNELNMGAVSFAEIPNENITVANIIGQDGYRKTYQDKTVHVKYDAIRSGLKTVFLRAAHTNASVHMPRMGCGLAGGEWTEIEKILSPWAEFGFNIYVYDF